ncbi:acyl-CoA dehydrogenase family protein [Streptomyces iranensis]|uniref:Acyl-CoA dehydrogenase domain protein (OzmD) n=1 Tax=Streptomyces iranensis TaxID=576784 RepID=A0A060ZQ46_9ACTN|nr:acyl-CoA dehydrogenase family protein [Streptomyces iranensis]MBP2061218.1 alkylation response protein AidB-like acyl-CoA dehydrogenase [Streptomyces iranensis]CDR05506.1 acyl-CoA dehydrogenase domain protein (OzmD) [Streptomyces iranensis]
MVERLAGARTLVGELVGDRADAWDLAGELPLAVLRELGGLGALCAQVPPEYGGLGLSSLDNGELTAHTGSLCSSVRSVQTSQGMAAWTIARLGTAEQRRACLTELTSGGLAAMAFSEPDAGSDLSAIETRIEPDGDEVVVTGRKVWVTAAAYADLIVVVGRFGPDAAVVVVPATAPGVHVERVPDPVGCRAAGHADVRLDSVRLPAGAVLGGGGQALSMVVTTALTYGRMSVAWGCVGILRACLRESTAHARSRSQFGRPLAEHQLVARRLAELLVAERVATTTCEHASGCWDSGDPDLAVQAVLAKHVSSGNAARGAASAVQMLASRAAQDGTPVARAYRDAKLMEIIEGTTEICQIVLAQHAMATAGRNHG